MKHYFFLLLFCIIAASFSLGFYLLYQTLFTPRITLSQVVQEALSETRGNYSIAIKHLVTGETYYFNSHKSYPTASLYKLWIMAIAYSQIERGALKEDESISEEVINLNRVFGLASGSAELTSGTVSFTIDSALYQMITVSHNYAALLLTQKVKLSEVKSFLESHDLKESVVGEKAPITTASDIALFFEKLYRGQLGNKESTSKMIKLLKKQQLNNKLPAGLPAGTIIAHKTGELETFSHDGGIVYSPRGDYIIVILSDTDYPPGAEQRIGKISRAVYDYFFNKKEDKLRIFLKSLPFTSGFLD